MAIDAMQFSTTIARRQLSQRLNFARIEFHVVSSDIDAQMIRLVIGLCLLIGGEAQAQIPPEIEMRLPPPYFRVYVVAVCAATEEINDDCVTQGLRNAAYALSEMYLRAYRGQLVWNSLRVRFPYGWAKASQTRLLRDVERQGIALASEKIAREATATNSDRLQSWQNIALVEAASGSNWSHDWGQYHHDFAPAHVTRQLAAAELRR